MNDEMADNEEEKLPDKSISVNNNSVNIHVVKQCVNTMPAFGAKMIDKTHDPNEQNVKLKVDKPISQDKIDKSMQSKQEKDQATQSTLVNDESTSLQNDRCGNQTITPVTKRTTDGIPSESNSDSIVSSEMIRSAIANHQQLKASAADRSIIASKQPKSESITLNPTKLSAEGNDRVTLDQPPNAALDTTIPLQSKVADVALKSDPTDKVVLIVDSNTTTESNTNPQRTVPTTATDIASSQSIRHLPVFPKPDSQSNKTPVFTSPQNTTKNTIPPLPMPVHNPNTTSSQIFGTAAIATRGTADPVKRSVSSSATHSIIDNRVSVTPNIQPSAQQVAEEEAIAALRAPLVNLYGTYLCHSKDTSLADARKRLRNAITQTRNLRQTFTERVYGKYRVCLRQPPTADEIIKRIETDPVTQFRKLKEEIASVREEKEIEKKEAAKLNSEMNQSNATDRVPALSNIDNAEQLMYLTAGLNLVLLPEEQTETELRQYAETYSSTNTTGRSRSSISQAAATAGEVILDRTRKAAAMRVERQRRRQLQLLRGEVVADGEAESNYSRLQVLAIAGSATHPTSSQTGKKSHSTTNVGGTTQTQSSTRRTVTASNKGIRSRSLASLPNSILLSLNASADEVKIDGNPSAATLALIARGVGPTIAKTTQQRLRHPHPESLGGRRRANINPGSMKKDDDIAVNPQPEPFLQSNLANTLPPLPASKERLERKRLPDEIADTPDSRRARHSIKNILKHFVESSDGNVLKPMSKINLLNSLRKKNSASSDLSIKDAKSSGEVDASSFPTKDACTTEAPDGELNPALTISILHALGVIGRSQTLSSQSRDVIPDLNLENKALCSDRLLSLRGKVVSANTTLIQSIHDYIEAPSQMVSSRKRTRSSNVSLKDPPSKVPKIEQLDDLANHKKENASSMSSIEQAETQPGQENDSDIIDAGVVAEDSKEEDYSLSSPQPDSFKPTKRKRSASSPSRLSNAGSQAISEQPHAHLLASTTPMNVIASTQLGASQAHFAQNAAMNMFQFANQLHNMHHPSAGDLAEYLGSFQHQQSYELPGLLAGTVPPQLPVFGLVPPTANFSGFTMQDRAATARAMLLREQQATAMLGQFQFQSQAAFAQLQTPLFPMGQSVSASVQPNFQKQNTSAEIPSAEPNQTEKKTHAGKGTSESTVHTQRLNNISLEQIDPSKRKRVLIEQPTFSAQLDQESGTGFGSTMNMSSLGRIGDMQFNPPVPPSNLRSEHADRIRSGLFHIVADDIEPTYHGIAVEYLIAVGSAVPIPKGLVLAPLKDRLNTPGFKSTGGNSTPFITRDVVAASILVWLWASQEKTFQNAFTINGRIDVDPDCKWLIHAAVDTAVGELSLEIAESVASGEGSFADAFALRKSSANVSTSQETANSEMPEATRKLDICTASIVCKALSAEMCVNTQMNSVLPMSSLLVDFLDEARLGALRTKSQERTLLATLIARNTFMSENFAHAYVSSMVRAGEALKHGRLFEIAQDEEVMASTMIPYDIFTDDTGAWEDPCKPDDGFTSGLCGDELVSRAHARAMIQKSLRKLQDRHHIRGGSSTSGPLVDSDVDISRANAGSSVKERPSLPTQRSGLKRRVSSMIEPPIVPGTGSAAARSWAVYHPRHHSSPLDWDRDAAENLPYGLHSRSRLLSTTNRRHDQDNTASTMVNSPVCEGSPERILLQSTSEINWVDVASIFQSVEVPRKPSRYKAIEPETHAAVDGTIFAPFFVEIDGENIADTSESDTEEDLTEATVLARHQVVLDSMKAKLEAYLEARKKQQERRKNKYIK